MNTEARARQLLEDCEDREQVIELISGFLGKFEYLKDRMEDQINYLEQLDIREQTPSALDVQSIIEEWVYEIQDGL